MRIARYSRLGEVSFGVVEGSQGGGTPGATSYDDLLVTELSGDPVRGFSPTTTRFPLPEVRLLPPVLPSKVVCIGRNYAAHIEEMGSERPAAPMIFLKPSTSLVGHGDAVVLPPGSGRVEHEGELAVVIGRLCKDVPVERVPEVVLGYTCANDVSDRDQQKADGQWARAKGHDTFCPLGPWIETDLNPSDLAIRTVVDGAVRQDSRTSLLLHDVATLVAYVSAAMTLLPGDVLLTGTPAGVGPLVDGSTVSVTVEGIGTLTNPVVSR